VGGGTVPDDSNNYSLDPIFNNIPTWVRSKSSYQTTKYLNNDQSDFNIHKFTFGNYDIDDDGEIHTNKVETLKYIKLVFSQSITENWYYNYVIDKWRHFSETIVKTCETLTTAEEHEYF
jgi:hypothetical protein